MVVGDIEDDMDIVEDMDTADADTAEGEDIDGDTSPEVGEDTRIAIR
jgi:hypothetical protein